jgi:hypothetical protein
VQVSIQGDTVVLVTDGLPNHGSPYWPTSDPRYEADTDPGFKQAPGNVIGTQHLTLRIPLHPAKAPAAQASHLGPIGLALNGVPFFNAKNAQNQGIQPGQGESVSFDQYHGHPNPQPANMYHYHIEPSYLTGKLGKDALLGFLLDGYPVYGPLKDGKTLTDSDLQANHGLATADGFGFQYRITADYPYIMGDTFYGTPGTAQ